MKEFLNVSYTRLVVASSQIQIPPKWVFWSLIIGDTSEKSNSSVADKARPRPTSCGTVRENPPKRLKLARKKLDIHRGQPK